MRRAGIVAAALMVAAMCTSVARAATAPPFAWRGIIEGFYGTPYTHADRMDLLRWEAAHGMNTFINAAKEDQYVRSSWREQYPPAQMTDLTKEVALAAHLGVRWIPDLGPGVPLIPSPTAAVPDRDICFSCAADRRVLLAKLGPFVKAGATAVMVSFDDVQKVSTHPEDASAYGHGDAAYGDMNADLLNWLVRQLPGVTVVTVPADYSGTSGTAYLSAFAKKLDPRVVVMWTGTGTVSSSIHGADARAFDKLLGRKVIVWDNYPVNDYAGGIFNNPWSLFLGPVLGRGRDLVGAIDGILANPAGGWQTSKIALATLADDLRDPAAYNPEASWSRAIAQLGGRDAPALAELADNSRSSSLGQSESIVFAPLAESFLTAYGGAYWPAKAGLLRRELTQEAAAPGRLTADHWNLEFQAEAAPFLARLHLNATVGELATAMLAAERPALAVTVRAAPGGRTITGTAAPPSPFDVSQLAAQLGPQEAAMMADTHNVHGIRFGGDFIDGQPTLDQNLMDAFVQHIAQLTAAWLPRAPQAASGVTVTLNGRPLPTHFTVFVPAGVPARIVATDGGGGQTGVAA